MKFITTIITTTVTTVTTIIFAAMPITAATILTLHAPFARPVLAQETAGPSADAATASVEFAAGVNGAGAQPAKIKWSEAYASALEEAVKNQKPVLIFVYASWCGWCKKMERETCADKTVVKLTGSFVCLKINSEEDEEFSSKYKVKEFPCVIFLKSDGTEIERHLGFKTAKEFAAVLEGVLKASK